MALSLATVGAKISATFMNLIISQVNLQGVTSVVPSNVIGGSASLTGRVSFSASSGVSLDGCFTSTYDDYLIVLKVPTVSASLSLVLNLRSSATNDTSANYDNQTLQVTSGTTVTGPQTLAGTNWAITPASSLHVAELTLFGPQLAQPTIAQVRATAATNPMTAATTTGFFNRGLTHRLSSAYDGIKVTPTGGTMTGTISVFGLNQ